MKVIALYKYTRTGGGVTVSPKPPVHGAYTETVRLIADDGFILTNGDTSCFCVDTDSPYAWGETVYLGEAF